ncbi:MAG: hypothetical protein C0518_12195 [Opitutus sp.]|nr:hypothetical protein [Opitutus sp.]
MNRPSLLRLSRRSALAIFAIASTCVAQAQYTEVPATVAPGRFLLEADALSLVVDREDTEKFTAVGAGLLLVTTGLASNWDIQVGAELFISQRYESGGFTDRRTGFGDLYVRTKWRFHESDWASVAILPYAKIPANSGDVGNDSVEGGVIVPWETYVLGGFLTINSMLDVSFIRNANDDGYETLFYFSSSATKQFTRFLSLYAELDASKSRSSYPWQTTLGVGAYLTISDHLSWDLAMYRGLNRNAPDWNPVVRVNYGF